MLLELILLATAVLLLLWYLYSPYSYWQKRGVPSTGTRSLLGDIPSTIHHQQHLIYEFDPIYEKFKGQYNYVGVYVLRQPQILITSPEAAKAVMVSDFKSFRDNYSSRPVTKRTDKLLGRYIFNMEGDEWKSKRKELVPGFSEARAKLAYPLIESASEKMSGFIARKMAEGPINVKNLSARFTAEITTNIIYGFEAGCFSDEKPQVLEMGKRFITGSTKFWNYLTLTSFLPFVHRYYKTTFVDEPVEDFFIGLMKDALEHRQSSGTKKADFLDHILETQNKKGYPVVESAGSGTNFFLDGFDTANIYMFHTLYELARNPDIQERLRQEISELGGKFSYDAVENMTYLEQVLCESARLHPPITMALKLCTERTELALNETQKATIEPGTIMNIPIFCLHKDARIYADPGRFNPDRFSPQNGGTKKFREECSFIPFGDGPRMCIGVRFAQAYVKRGILEIVKNFKMTLNSKTRDPLRYEPRAFLYISAKNDVWIDFERVQGV